MAAGVYASVIHYLKAVDRVGSAADGKAVVAAIKALPTDDPSFGKGYIRSDGRKIHPMYLMEVKAPDESKSAWDLWKIASTISGERRLGRELFAGYQILPMLKSSSESCICVPQNWSAGSIDRAEMFIFCEFRRSFLRPPFKAASNHAAITGCHVPQR